jgi:hypothetical protein
LRPSVERAEAEKASTRIHLGVSALRALGSFGLSAHVEVTDAGTVGG